MWGSTLCIIVGLLGGAIERFTRSEVTKKLDSHLNQLE